MDVGYHKRLVQDRFRHVLGMQPDAGAIEFYGEWLSWRDLARIAAAVSDALDDAGVADGAQVAWFARNRPSAVGAALGILSSGRCCSVVNPHRAEPQLIQDFGSASFAAAVAEAEDWQRPGVLDAAGALGIVALQVDSNRTERLSRLRAGHAPSAVQPGPGGLALVLLSSGTSTDPRRIPFDWRQLALFLERASGAGGRSLPSTLQRSATLLQNSFAHAGGGFYMLMSIYHARPMVLFETFSLELWVDAVRRHKPRVASLVPALLREVLAGDVPEGALASLKAIRVGSAPLDSDVQRAFERRFGIPVLVDYTAAEPRGVLAYWTLDDHRRYAESKRGSVGRIAPDIDMRVVDAGTGAPLQPGEVGRLEARPRNYGEPSWAPTSDLGFIDGDGFVFITGCEADTIVRGGLKVLPDAVAAVLRRHPAVHDIAVLGRPDREFGQVLIAVIELSEAAATVDPAEMTIWARSQLAPYEVPTEFKVVERLPRTVSLTIDRPALKAMLAAEIRD